MSRFDIVGFFYYVKLDQNGLINANLTRRCLILILYIQIHIGFNLVSH